jgi:hypothetical protein
MASWLNVPVGFLAFILESDYLKVFNFCCFSQFNIVYSNIHGVYTIAFYYHAELIAASFFVMQICASVSNIVYKTSTKW